MAYSFGTSGSTPLVNSLLGGGTSLGIGNTQSTTPQSKALNSAVGYSAPQIGPSSLAMLQSAGKAKSQTITTPDGSAHTMTYATDPVSGSGTSSSSNSNNSTPKSTGFIDPLGVTAGQAAAGEAKYGSGNPGLLSNPNGVSSGGIAPQGTEGGAVSTSPTIGPTVPFSATNPPTSQSGLIGAALGQAQGYYDTQGGLTSKIQDIDKNFANQEAALGEGYTGLGTNTPSQVQALENFKNNAVAAISGQQATQAGYETPLANTYATGINAAAPQLGAPGQQYYQPLQAGTNNNGNGISPEIMQSYAQMAANGQLSEVPTAITSNPVLNAQLNAAAKTINPNYNPVLSNAAAATTQTGQQLQTAATAANAALDTLSSAFNSLPGVQTGGIPATNAIANWIGTQFGEGALTKFKANLADARSQLVGALNAAGGTPTENEATALQYLPDDMTTSQFNQNVGTAQNPGIVRQLLQQKVSSFVQSGQSNNQNQNASTNNTNGSLFNW